MEKLFSKFFGNERFRKRLSEKSCNKFLFDRPQPGTPSQSALGNQNRPSVGGRLPAGGTLLGG